MQQIKYSWSLYKKQRTTPNYSGAEKNLGKLHPFYFQDDIFISFIAL